MARYPWATFRRSYMGNAIEGSDQQPMAPPLPGNRLHQHVEKGLVRTMKRCRRNPIGEVERTAMK